MPTWWGKSSSKEAKKKASKESFIDTLHRKFKIPSEGKLSIISGGSRRRCNDTISEKGDRSPSESRSPSPTNKVGRCQSFAERPLAQPLPLPGLHPSSVGRVDSEISISVKSRLEKVSKPSLFLPLPTPGCIRCGTNPADMDGDMVTATGFSDCSADSDEPADSRNRSPLATDSEIGTGTAAGSPSSLMLKDQTPAVSQLNSRDVKKPANILSNHTSSTSPKRRPLRHHVQNLQVPPHGTFYSGPDSSLSSPSRSPLRAFGTDQVLNSAFWAGKPYPEFNLAGSGHCSSPGSGHNSGHNSMGGDMSGPLFWQPSRGSPEYSPVPSPRMTSPGPSSRIQSGAVTPIHPRAAGTPTESQTGWIDDGKQQSHRLPLPPLTVTNSSPFSHSNSAATSPSMPRSPARADSPMSSGSRWKKGKLLGRGTFGHVYIGFNSESGEMCAMKEVTLFSDDAKSMESAKQLMQEVHLLSRLRHPNIVQYYGSETVDDKLYIYLEYVSGGSIHKLLQEYGQFGELAIRSYTQQILSGLAYLHAKNTLHRDIKGANILVDPNGRVKVADFGMAKHVIGVISVVIILGSLAECRVVSKLNNLEYPAINCRKHSAVLTDFGAVGDGKTSNTKAFNSAISKLSQYANDGGAILIVPPGKWLTGSFNLTSHFTLFLQKDAVLLASQDESEWPQLPILPSYGRGRDAPEGRFSSFIFGTNLTDVVITGNNGTIDGQGSSWWEKFHKGQMKLTRPYLIEIMYSNQIQISNLTLINSPSWFVHPIYSRDIILQGLTILAPVDSPNTDGIDPDSCTDVKIEDVYIVSGDDCIAVKSGWDEYGIKVGMPSQHIIIRRLTCVSPDSAMIALGSEMSGGIQDIRAEDNVAINTQSAVRIKTAVGRGAYVKNIFVKGMQLNTMKYVFWMTGSYGSHPDPKFDPKALPQITGINYRDIAANNVTYSARLDGIPNDPFTGICISNVTIQVSAQKKKLQWNCTDITGVSNNVIPKPCELLKEKEGDCPYPSDKLPIESVQLKSCSVASSIF